MEVATSIHHCTAMNIIDIDDDDEVSVIYATPKSKGISISDAISVEEYFEKGKHIISSLSSKASSSGTKKAFIDIDDYDDEADIQFLGSKCGSNVMSINILDDHDDIFTCDICVDEKSVTTMFRIMGCTHSYCKQCISKYVASKVQQNVTRVSCPVSGCKGLLEPYWCRSILPKQVFDRWGDALCEGMIMEFEKFYCPYKDCSAVLINECRGENMVISQSECLECKRLFCAKCKVPWHIGIVCKEFQKLHKDEREREDIQLMQLAKNQEWKRCPKCRIYVARTEGCAQMKCRCGCDFCYKCGAQSTNHYCRSCGT